jgi:ABC-type glycerol-3-phosphate transport system substrate-binding protein
MTIFALILVACGAPAEEATQAPEATTAPEAAPTEEMMEEGVQIRFTFYADGNEADVMQGLVDDFMADNPDISVVLDVVP